MKHLLMVVVVVVAVAVAVSGIIMVVVVVLVKIASVNVAVCVGMLRSFASTQGAFIVVHPHFEHPFFHADFVAESDNDILVSLLHLPTNPVREFVHLFFLILGKFRPEPFSPVRVRHGVGCGPRAWRRRHRDGVVFLRCWAPWYAGAQGEKHVGSGGVV